MELVGQLLIAGGGSRGIEAPHRPIGGLSRRKTRHDREQARSYS
jgi:hypothetical protein